MCLLVFEVFEVFILVFEVFIILSNLGNNKVTAISKYSYEISKDIFVKLSPKVINAQCVLDPDHGYMCVCIYIYIYIYNRGEEKL